MLYSEKSNLNNTVCMSDFVLFNVRRDKPDSSGRNHHVKTDEQRTGSAVQLGRHSNKAKLCQTTAAWSYIWYDPFDNTQKYKIAYT